MTEPKRPLTIRITIVPKIGAYYGVTKEFEAEMPEEGAVSSSAFTIIFCS